MANVTPLMTPMKEATAVNPMLGKSAIAPATQDLTAMKAKLAMEQRRVSHEINVPARNFNQQSFAHTPISQRGGALTDKKMQGAQIYRSKRDLSGRLNTTDEN